MKTEATITFEERISNGLPTETNDLIEALLGMPGDSEVYVQLDEHVIEELLVTKNGRLYYPVKVATDNTGDLIITVSTADNVLFEER